ncbi:MAG TPA: 3-deoxy-manno-octulosonate cytidylyltransferase [Chthoniobacterales bacterium]|nr:3-deoxy-manno-octulosonate cytidylyltransferase [Chthoniobacterales bacterium]
MSKAVGIIPARWGSTRFPGKALHVIAGKPLLQHVWERCRRARKLDQLIIATDDFRIAEAAFDWGAEVAMTSANHASGTDRIAEVAAKLKQFAHVINIQGDEPLIDPKLIDRLVRTLQRDRKLEMITAAHPFAYPREAESPHQVKVVLNQKGEALYFSRALIPFGRDHASTSQYFRHQGIYGYTRKLLLQFVRWTTSPLERAEALEQLRALENGVKIQVVMTGSGSPGVDTPEDAEAVAASLGEVRDRASHVGRRRVAQKATATGKRER